MVSHNDVRRLCAEPYDTLEDAVAAAVELARGGWQVILGPPTRTGGVWVLARVSHYETGVPVGHIEYRT